MNPVSTTPRGRAFVRTLVCRALGHVGPDARGFALDRWGSAAAEVVTKSTVTALLAQHDPEAQEFFAPVLERSLLGRLSGLRRVPFNVRMLSMQGGTRGYWTSPGAPRPISKPAMAGAWLQPSNVGALIVATSEALREGGPVAEAGLHRDLERALTDAIDGAFLSGAGGAGQPPSIAHGAVTITATGDPAADLAALVDAFQGDLSAAYFVCDPTTATRLALVRDAGGQYPFADCGPRGGTLLGIPLLTSRGSPIDSNGGQVMLIDPSAIAFDSGALRIDPAPEATLMMSDTPTSPVELVSMFQTDSIAWRAGLDANWEVQLPGGVVCLTGVQY